MKKITLNFTKSIKLKLVIICLILVFIVMVVSGLFMLTTVRLQETQKTRDNLKSFAQYINEQIVQANDNPGDFQSAFQGVYRSESTSGNYNSLQASILDMEGSTIATSLMTANVKYNRSVIISAMTGVEAFSSGKKDTEPNSGLVKSWEEYACRVTAQSGVSYIVYTRVDSEPITTRMLQLGTTIFIAAALAMLLAGLIGFILANTITAPIIFLTRKAREMAEGKLKQKIISKSGDEIGLLTESFNDMAYKLDQNMETIERDKTKMEIIIHNMTDGVLMYGKSGELLHVNAMGRELLNMNNIENYYFNDIMLRLGVDIDHFNDADNNSDIIKDIDDKFVSVNLIPYQNALNEIEGYVIVLSDITKHKKLDNMRKEFVANVSHEIRTPITTIKTYTETLLDWALEDRKQTDEFLNIIVQEADRMTVLVEDLLTLSRFDSMQLSFSVIDLSELIEDCIRQNRIFAAQKNLSVTFDKPSYPVSVNVDPTRINQVIHNIISNAVKYTNNGGEIRISIADSEKYHRVYISDNGMGIPREDQPHIFERFYRVDKARSRDMGGTGLGLAIAKECMEAHGGKITMVSEAGKGTTMILRFDRMGGNRNEHRCDSKT